MFDYFYGAQAEQFAFYWVSKVLFTNDRFKYLSAEAKTLYGILLDRVPLPTGAAHLNTSLFHMVSFPTLP